MHARLVRKMSFFKPLDGKSSNFLNHKLVMKLDHIKIPQNRRSSTYHIPFKELFAGSCLMRKFDKYFCLSKSIDLVQLGFTDRTYRAQQ